MEGRKTHSAGTIRVDVATLNLYHAGMAIDVDTSASEGTLPKQGSEREKEKRGGRRICAKARQVREVRTEPLVMFKPSSVTLGVAVEL